MLLSVWKLFKYSTIKKEVFNDMQRVYELTPLNVIKACTTRWLTHGEACWRIISRFEPLVDALDAIYNEKRCPNVKGVRDALLQPQNICMLLLVAELLVPINYFSKFLQTRSLNYSSIKNNLGSVIQRLELIQEGSEDYDAIDSSLVHFHKVVKFLTISAERMELARPLRNRVLVNVDEIKVKVNNFLYVIGYNFVERLLEEVNKALEEASDVLIAYDVFNPDNDQRKSMLYCEEQFSVLANHYRNEIFDEYNGDTVHANCLI